LIEPDNDYPEESDDEDLAEGLYPMGHFACPMVAMHSFQVLKRVRTQVALNTLSSLISFMSIKNRPLMFVYSSDSAVFYMRLEANPLSGSMMALSDTVSFGTRSIDEAGFERLNTSADGDSPHPPSPGVSRKLFQGTPTLSRTNENCIFLKIYGLEPAPEAITVDMVEKMETKLAFVAQTALATFLVRNTSMKPTLSDVQFILPLRKPPTVKKYIQIPPQLAQSVYFSLYLKQNVSNFMHPFTGPMVSIMLMKHYEQRDGFADNEYTR
jgi:hypothetical protein